MWLSKQMRTVPPAVDADLGVTSISGENVGVITRGEVRSLPIYGPGGYVWLPESGAAVLVMKGGPGGEERCVSGMQQRQAPEDMKPGEVFLFGPNGNEIYLKGDGSVELRGNVQIQGQLIVNGEAYQPCKCAEEVS